jgi:hypothetical protein
MPPPKWTQDEVFLKELLLCVCQKSAADPKFGTTKLKTLLDFSDFLPYAGFRKPIIRFDQKNSNGSASRKFVPFREQVGNSLTRL